MFPVPQFVPPTLEQLTQEIDEITVLVKREAQLNHEVGGLGRWEVQGWLPLPPSRALVSALLPSGSALLAGAVRIRRRARGRPALPTAALGAAQPAGCPRLRCCSWTQSKSTIGTRCRWAWRAWRPTP